MCVPIASRFAQKIMHHISKKTVSDQLFLQFFQKFGEVIDSVVLSDRKTKRSRGFGFVTFADPVSVFLSVKFGSFFSQIKSGPFFYAQQAQHVVLLVRWFSHIANRM
jgi:hypothetical protein